MIATLVLIAALKVTPSVCLAPCQWVRIVATVERASSNRYLVLQMDGEVFFRSTTIQLDGDQAAKTHRLEIPQVPAGNYEILAVLFDSTHEVERKRITLNVTNGEELQPTRKRSK